ncbi:hypothetical protein [Hydrotalea sp.]|uniref:hypothetical protein n=1 Tax=Hydrotalea sp. TaxID=2881279 RepID=UPI00261E52FB|nr:hypothetical protein [Hydrotalea sp.]
MKFHIETSPGYGTKQGIMPRFYLQMENICKFLNGEPFLDKIPSTFLSKIIPELTNFYDVRNKLQTTIQEFIQRVQDGTLYRVDTDGSTTFLRKKEFEISNLTKDFFIRGKVLLVLFFKSDILIDGNFKIEDFYFCDDKKFERKCSEYKSGQYAKYLPLLNVLKKARHDFLNEFSRTRGDIEHEDFALERFKLIQEATNATLQEPNFQGNKLSERINFYYEQILDLIEKLTVYFAAINCEAKNNFYQLYVATVTVCRNLAQAFMGNVRNYHYDVQKASCHKRDSRYSKGNRSVMKWRTES